MVLLSETNSPNDGETHQDDISQKKTQQMTECDPDEDRAVPRLSLNESWNCLVP